jgi:hypothetical protein
VKQAAEKMQKDFGLPVALVIIDTAGKAAGLTKTGDLNDDTVAKTIMKALDDASKATGALFMGVAHFGKNVETGTKGSSGFEDDADVVLALLGDKGINGKVDTPRLCVRKRRSGANGDEHPFRTVVVSMGEDEDGDEVTTLRIEWLTGGEAEVVSAKTKNDPWAAKSLRLLRQVMMNMLADCGSVQKPYPDGPEVRAVDIELVRAEFYKSHPATGDAKAKSDARRQAFNRAIKDAQAKGLIGSRDIGDVTYVWLARSDDQGKRDAGDQPQTNSSIIAFDGRQSGRRANDSPFQKVGPAEPGLGCIQCYGKDGELFMIKDRRKPGTQAEVLHEDCAPKWFGPTKSA